MDHLLKHFIFVVFLGEYPSRAVCFCFVHYPKCITILELTFMLISWLWFYWNRSGTLNSCEAQIRLSRETFVHRKIRRKQHLSYHLPLRGKRYFHSFIKRTTIWRSYINVGFSVLILWLRQPKVCLCPLPRWALQHKSRRLWRLNYPSPTPSHWALTMHLLFPFLGPSSCPTLRVISFFLKSAALYITMFVICFLQNFQVFLDKGLLNDQVRHIVALEFLSHTL